jgi:hypothetical protein
MVHILQAMHPYYGETEKELSFSKGDFIVVRKVYFHFIILSRILELKEKI